MAAVGSLRLQFQPQVFLRFQSREISIFSCCDKINRVILSEVYLLLLNCSQVTTQAIALCKTNSRCLHLEIGLHAAASVCPTC